ncbi:helix-turn-helix transcriptional regulator [Aeribacillus pallidus]|uniref:helix-turn-helix domain-containing protein n=1 Tax=Aeribacillus pallidus TaxID=33936 RepID=UPI001F2231B5|nr:helix-turn-helix transcriptional regulator [Aeribacillus pallidus]MDR9795092.1 helix-turn-helix transcriptional regulator [Aeribacillus pallidus]
MGISQPRLSRIENGDQEIPISLIKKFCYALLLGAETACPCSGSRKNCWTLFNGATTC